MLKLTVELLPCGSPGSEHVGTCLIENNGTGSEESGNYTVRFITPGKGIKSIPKTKIITVTNFPRLKDDFWKLLFLSLEQYHKKGVK